MCSSGSIRHALLQLIMHGWLWRTQVDVSVTRGRWGKYNISRLSHPSCAAVQVAHYSRSIRSFYLCSCWSLILHSYSPSLATTDNYDRS